MSGRFSLAIAVDRDGRMECAPIVLDRPAAMVGRSVAREYLRRWARARARLYAPDDPQALHRFRVELRRLRSVLRAFRLQREGRLTGKTRRRLRRLAAITSESRNLQVEHAWVEKQLEGLNSAEQEGARWLLARMADQERIAQRRVERRLGKWFRPLRRRLRQALVNPKPRAASPSSGPPLSTRALVARTVRQWTTTLEKDLAGIGGVSDLQAAHSARITAKRLRYLLEPFESALPDGPAIIASLTALQGALGQLQDAHVLGDALREALAEMAAQRACELADRRLGRHAPETPTAGAQLEAGLLTLIDRVREEADHAFERLRAGWLEGKATPLLAQLRKIGRGRRALNRVRGDPAQARGVLRRDRPRLSSAGLITKLG
jgi:CHAD domain-containing protein